MAQFLRPDGNITQTSFTNGFAQIDEAIASDADFAYGANNAAAELEVSLTNGTDPQLSTGHIFRYRLAKTNAGVVDGAGNAVTVTVRLMQGTTEIATDTAKTVDGTWTQYSFTLSEAQADAITDYTDLRLEFLTTASGGSPANRRGGAVSWAELEIPDVSLITTNRVHAQAQANIKATYNAFAQGQALIVRTENAFAQAQGTILQTYNSFGQAQGYLPVTIIESRAFGQALALIGVTDNLYTAIDETVPSDSDYILPQLAQSGIPYTVRFRLSDVSTPMWKKDHILRWRSIGLITIDLYQGTGGIASTNQNSSSFTTFEYRLSDAEMQSITDYSDLEVEIITIGKAFISWVEFQVPSSPPITETYAHGQAQALIKATYNAFANTQAYILAIVNAFGQAQAQIQATYNGFGQAQAHIVTTVNQFAQAQAQILQTYVQHGQAQATIRGNAFGQTQAHIRVTDISTHGQAQATIKTTYAEFGQAQAYVKTVDNNAYGQAQANILATSIGSGQAQADIKSTYQSYAQAQGTILAVTTSYGQAQAVITATYQGHGQTQAYLRAFDQNVFGQAQGNIKFTGTAGSGQAQAQIRAFDQNTHGQSQADIKATYVGLGQSQGTIKATSVGLGQSQADIKTTYNQHAQAQGYVQGAGVSSGNAQAQIKTSYIVHGQANALIVVTDNTVHGQTQAKIVNSYQSYGQAQATIRGNAFAQAGAQILATYTGSGNAQALISTNVIVVAQSQATIKATYSASGQSQALITSGTMAHGQALAQILATYIVYAQAETFILKSAGYGQAQAVVHQPHILEDLIISDEHSMIFDLSNEEEVIIGLSQSDEAVIGTSLDEIGISIELDDESSLGGE